MSTPWGLMIPGRPPLGLKYMLQEQSILVEQGGHTGVVVVRGGRVGGQMDPYKHRTNLL